MADYIEDQPEFYSQVPVSDDVYRHEQFNRVVGTAYSSVVAVVGQLIVKPASMENLGDVMTASGAATAFALGILALSQWSDRT